MNETKLSHSMADPTMTRGTVKQGSSSTTGRGLSSVWLLAGLVVVVAALGVLLINNQSKVVQQSTTHGTAQIGDPPFQLTDQAGRTVTPASLRGHPFLVFFGYSFCPDECPAALNAMSLGLQAYESKHPKSGAQIVPVFITVDPARDTRARLADYAKNFHPRLLALTGSATAIQSAESAYKISASREPVEGDPNDYAMDHPSIIFLMGGDGRFINLMSGELTADRVATLLGQLPS